MQASDRNKASLLFAAHRQLEIRGQELSALADVEVAQGMDPVILQMLLRRRDSVVTESSHLAKLLAHLAQRMEKDFNTFRSQHLWVLNAEAGARPKSPDFSVAFQPRRQSAPPLPSWAQAPAPASTPASGKPVKRIISFRRRLSFGRRSFSFGRCACRLAIHERRCCSMLRLPPVWQGDGWAGPASPTATQPFIWAEEQSVGRRCHRFGLVLKNDFPGAVARAVARSFTGSVAARLTFPSPG